MTKQEEIREGIKLACKCGNCLGGYIMFQGKKSRKCYQCYKGYKLDINAIISHLHSQGVVIKVDRELPKRQDSYFADKMERAEYEHTQKQMVEAGYVAVEPLVEEK